MSDEPEVVGESRIGVTVAVLFAGLLPIFMPASFVLAPKWVIPTLIGALCIALVVADPGKIDRLSVNSRRLSIALLLVLVVAATWSTIRLTDHLINGGPELNNAKTLLRVGGIVWLDNGIAFALLYWELERGGPAVRAHGLRKRPDLAFVEDINPDLAPPNWRPHFVDFLYLSLTNALAFSPTDTMPLARWAKLTMALQSLISLALLALVLARAVNILQ